MRCLVVYESMYGNTHEIASAVGKGLDHLGEVNVRAVSDVPPKALGEVDLLVVGGPTHVHGMTRESTRRAAAQEAERDDAIELDADAPGPGLRTWLASLDQVGGSRCAVFDTRIDKPVLLVGSAAKGISKRLRRLGYDQILDSESFFVDDSAGPLRAGERDRAQQWGTMLAHEWGRITRYRSV